MVSFGMYLFFLSCPGITFFCSEVLHKCCYL
uniref:Uncharacterized protein n=1 Tax=Anguilla anguilla TaxID=7936 RepID=A0A0E9R3I6_ANGAN